MQGTAGKQHEHNALIDALALTRMKGTESRGSCSLEEEAELPPLRLAASASSWRRVVRSRSLSRPEEVPPIREEASLERSELMPPRRPLYARSLPLPVPPLDDEEGEEEEEALWC